MHEIGAFEAKNRFSQLLDQVERGGEVTITRRGRPVAKLVPARAGANSQAAQAAVTRILERSRGVTLGGIGLKSLVEEGRE